MHPGGSKGQIPEQTLAVRVASIHMRETTAHIMNLVLPQSSQCEELRFRAPIRTNMHVKRS